MRGVTLLVAGSYMWLRTWRFVKEARAASCRKGVVTVEFIVQAFVWGVFVFTSLSLFD